jgi:hypothetical protein
MFVCDSLVPNIILVFLRNGCWGGYLDLSWRNLQEAGKNCNNEEILALCYGNKIRYDEMAGHTARIQDMRNAYKILV